MAADRAAERAADRAAERADAPGLAARAEAMRLISAVLHDGIRLPGTPGAGPAPAPADRARAGHLADLVLRHVTGLDRALSPFLAKAPNHRVRTILRLAAADLLLGGTPDHAAVSSAVALARRHPKTAAFAGLINAVLRRLAEAPRAPLPPERLPGWLRAPLLAGHGPDVVAAIEAVHAGRPPLDLTARDPGLAAELAERIGGGAFVLPTGSIRLPAPGQVSALPGFADGAFWVQDAAAALPARLLGEVRGAEVLDLCAAPGGKTMQLAAAGARVTALDLSAPRLRRLRANLDRTGLAAEVLAADLLQFAPGRRWDAILLDAPCTASGTIRRHPDLPLVLDGGAVAGLVRLQARMLERAFALLAPGGRLVFSTCSLLPAEGPDHVAGRSLLPFDLPGLPEGALADRQLRLRPDMWAEIGGIDGFFAALLSA